MYWVQRFGWAVWSGLWLGYPIQSFGWRVLVVGLIMCVLVEWARQSVYTDIERRIKEIQNENTLNI